MDLSILIKILLNDHETVIIPGFGAFVAVYKPAVIRENDIIPPGKEIRFFHQIKNNDGLLAMHIARSKKISYDDAFKRIERAASKIIYQLDKGEKVAFGELGEFSYNEKGEIEFTIFESAEPVIPAGFEPVSLEDVVETAEETQDEPFVEAQSIVTEEPEMKVENGKSEQKLSEDSEPIQQELKEEVIQETKKPTLQVPFGEPAKPAVKEKKRSFAWLWILLLIVGIPVVAFFLFKNGKQTPKDAEPGEIKIEIAQPEIANTDTVQSADTMATAVSQPTSNSLTAKYHLVGGGFKSEENAVKFINRLKERGIEGTLLGQNGNMFLVGIASFNTKEEAFDELNRRMRENPEWKLWVHEK